MYRIICWFRAMIATVKDLTNLQLNSLNILKKRKYVRINITMSETKNKLTIKYSGLDKFGAHKFSSSEEIDESTYSTLSRLDAKMKAVLPDQYSPLFKSEAYNSYSIRMEVPDAVTLKKNNIYKMTYEVKTRRKIKDDSQYVVIKILGRPTFVRDDSPVEETFNF